MSKTHFTYKILQFLFSIGLMLDGYKICLNKSNYPIFNMHDFGYWLIGCAPIFWRTVLVSWNIQ